MGYQDYFNEDEFDIFRKFNNKDERKERHIDTYFIEDSEEDIDKIEYNYSKLIDDTIQQMKRMRSYFLDDLEEGN